MALDAICLTAVVEELRRTLEGGKIDKIYQPSRDEVVMAIRGAGENVKLLLSASPNGPRMHLTKEVRENPAQPPMFCMLLRKHLTGGRILALEQPELERIVLLRLEVVDELGDRVPRTLVLEAMGRSANLLLLDEPINGLDPEGIVEFRNLLLRLNQERQTTILISSHILSELANLATCYGFLDNGMMLEQISARALEEKCRACIEARVDDASRAALVLEQSLGIRDYEVLPGHLLRIYSSLDAPHRVAQALVEGGVALQSIESRGANLEDYFLSMIGGVRHA